MAGRNLPAEMRYQQLMMMPWRKRKRPEEKPPGDVIYLNSFVLAVADKTFSRRAYPLHGLVLDWRTGGGLPSGKSRSHAFARGSGRGRCGKNDGEGECEQTGDTCCFHDVDLVAGGVPVRIGPRGSKHRLRKVINRRPAKPSTSFGGANFSQSAIPRES